MKEVVNVQINGLFHTIVIEDGFVAFDVFNGEEHLAPGSDWPLEGYIDFVKENDF